MAAQAAEVGLGGRPGRPRHVVVEVAAPGPGATARESAPPVAGADEPVEWRRGRVPVGGRWRSEPWAARRVGAGAAASAAGAPIAGGNPADPPGVGEREQLSGDLADDRDDRRVPPVPCRRWSGCPAARPDRPPLCPPARRLPPRPRTRRLGRRLGSSSPTRSRVADPVAARVGRPRVTSVSVAVSAVGGLGAAASAGLGAADPRHTPSRGPPAPGPGGRRSRRARRRRSECRPSRRRSASPAPAGGRSRPSRGAGPRGSRPSAGPWSARRREPGRPPRRASSFR